PVQQAAAWTPAPSAAECRAAPASGPRLPNTVPEQSGSPQAAPMQTAMPAGRPAPAMPLGPIPATPPPPMVAPPTPNVSRPDARPARGGIVALVIGMSAVIAVLIVLLIWALLLR